MTGSSHFFFFLSVRCSPFQKWRSLFRPPPGAMLPRLLDGTRFLVEGGGTGRVRKGIMGVVVFMAL